MIFRAIRDFPLSLWKTLWVSLSARPETLALSGFRPACTLKRQECDLNEINNLRRSADGWMMRRNRVALFHDKTKSWG